MKLSPFALIPSYHFAVCDERLVCLLVSSPNREAELMLAAIWSPIDRKGQQRTIAIYFDLQKARFKLFS